MNDKVRDAEYVEFLLEPIRACMTYKPSFGQSEKGGLKLSDFRRLYGSDPFYHWVGMDSEFMYAAHKAAGGMTSIYRQLGTGSERLVRHIIKDALQFTDEEIKWSYKIIGEDNKPRTLTLDARIDSEFIQNNDKRERVIEWTERVARKLDFSKTQVKTLLGSVFEIRQGYKSQDAKRQNADLQSAMHARNDNYVFVMAVMSTRISNTLRRRYQNSQMLVLVGNQSGDDLDDTFAFIEQVIGFPIVDFFQRNSQRIRTEFEAIVKALLSPQG